MDGVEIIKLPPDSWQDYKNLRLKSLRSDPEAYGFLYGEAVEKSDQDWIEPLKLAEQSENHWTFFARLNGLLVGMVSARETNPPDVGPTVKIGEVFVSKEARGKKIGKKLMERLIQEIEEDSKWKKILVKVFVTQTPAITLYKNMGFEVIKQIHEEWRDGRSHETFVMEREIG